MPSVSILKLHTCCSLQSYVHVYCGHCRGRIREDTYYSVFSHSVCTGVYTAWRGQLLYAPWGTGVKLQGCIHYSGFTITVCDTHWLNMYTISYETPLPSNLSGYQVTFIILVMFQVGG